VLAALREADGIDSRRVVVVGHSAGATIAIRLACAHDWLAGVVLLSAAARSGEDVMRQQSQRIAASMRGLARLRARSFLQNQERVRRNLQASVGDVASIDGVDLPARWLREFMAYHPTTDLPSVRCPILAVTGRNDIQVDAGDIDLMRKLVTGPFVGETPADLTHVLRRHPGRPSLDSYPAQLAEPVDGELLDTVASWVAAL
jgi:uncharacterized protein